MRYYPDLSPDTPELIIRRHVVDAQVQGLFSRFLAAKRIEMGESTFQHLTNLAATSGIDAAARELRQTIGWFLKLPDFDSASYWRMIDAIGAVHDSRLGVWPLMGVCQRDNSLNHALVHVSEVESLISPVAEPATNHLRDR